MDSQNTHEIAFIESFVVKQKKLRLLSLVQNRKKFCLLLAHNIELNTKYAHPLRKGEDNEEQIYKLLRKYGAPLICHIICENSRYDNTEMNLKEVLHELYARDFGYIISCIPGNLAYYQGEDSFNKVILLNQSSNV